VVLFIILSLQHFGIKWVGVRRSEGCTEIDVKLVNMHQFLKKFTIVLLKFRRTTLPLEVINRKTLTAQLYPVKVQNPIFRVLVNVFDPQMRGKRDSY